MQHEFHHAHALQGILEDELTTRRTGFHRSMRERLGRGLVDVGVRLLGENTRGPTQLISGASH